MSYAQLEEAVARWGVQKFQHFKGDVIIRMKSKCKVSQFELDCSAVWPRLTGWVRHHEEVSDDVIYWESERHRRQCPGEFALGATPQAKRLPLVRWSQRQDIICDFGDPVGQRGARAVRCLLFAASEVGGKSKLGHLVAQELIIGPRGGQVHVHCPHQPLP